MVIEPPRSVKVLNIMTGNLSLPARATGSPRFALRVFYLSELKVAEGPGAEKSP